MHGILTLHGPDAYPCDQYRRRVCIRIYHTVPNHLKYHSLILRVHARLEILWHLRDLFVGVPPNGLLFYT